MVHRPKSVIAYVFLLLIALGVAYVVVSLPDTSARPWVWGALAVIGIVIASLVAIAWRRRVEAARERAWAGSFSFADVVTRRREEEARRDESPA